MAALNYGGDPNFHYDRARVHLDAKRHAEALEDLDSALTIAPDRPDILVDRPKPPSGSTR